MNRELFSPLSVSLRSFLVSERLVAAMLDLFISVKLVGKWRMHENEIQGEKSKNLRFTGKKNNRTENTAYQFDKE